MWMHPDYYKSYREASSEGTVDHIEDWQDALSKLDGVLYHQPSGTLLGGKNGVVHVARVLVDLTLNILAVRGDFDPPEEPPRGYDLSRLQINAHDRVVAWTEKWTAAINASTKILSTHSDERRVGRDLATASNESTCDEPPATRANTPSAPIRTASTASKKQKRAKRAQKAKSKSTPHTRDNNVESTTDTESDIGEEVDFEGLDKTSQDEEEEEDWEQWGGGDGGLELGNSGTNPGIRRPVPDVDDDDEQHDRLELRYKYGFTQGNTYERDEGTDPIVTSHSSGTWSPSDGVFGCFADLPPYKDTHLHSPHAVVKQLRKFGAECEETLQNFDVYMAANPRVTSVLADNAKIQAKDFPTHIQPLYEALFLRKATWKRAETIARGVHGYAQRMAHILREGFQLYLTAQRFIQQGDFPDPNLTALNIETAVNKSKRGLVEIRWTYNELLAFQKLATEQYNALEGNWMAKDIPTDTTTLIQVVQGLVDWADKAATLVTQLQSKRSATWEKNMTTSFHREYLSSGMDYRFGCPAIIEEPKDLRDTLALAKSLVGRTPIPAPSTAEPHCLITPTTTSDIVSTTTHSATGTSTTGAQTSGDTATTPESSAPVTSSIAPIAANDLTATPSLDPISKTPSSGPAHEKSTKRKDPPDSVKNLRRVSARLANSSTELQPPKTRSSTQAKNTTSAGKATPKVKNTMSTKRAKK
ncbi:unnamed protein product [Rhizoctonia solani]|uniref:Uncharacterized protein n=1 Tax=Rhizoctonia solani TaxID=456999 RepID=A0A8H3E9H0_9AGAM|nr:unnamed protein product [Rhizoctonia solani]